MRTMLIVHRYLGVVVGLVMALWCLSGFVMIYRGYPAVTAAQRLRGLEPLQLNAASPESSLGEAPLADFRIEMLAGRPLLRLYDDGGGRMIDLSAAAPVERAGPKTAAAQAAAYAAGQGVRSPAQPPRLIYQDQWTVEGAGSRGPVYRVAFADPARTVVYVASRTGEVVQATDRQSRLWAWLGAVPHWLYPHALRRHAQLWTQVVTWTSTAGVFLTGTGLYVGIMRLRRTRDRRWSPYQGWRFWHHMAGLVFGLFTLTWVASGLLTMNPWGLLESSAGEQMQAPLAGHIAPADAAAFLRAAPGAVRPGAVALEAAPLGGRLHVIERFADGRVLRLDGQGRPEPLGRLELAAALAGAGERAVSLELMRKPDAYYYPGADNSAPLPVWKATLAGPGGRVAYLEPASGRVRLGLDATARASRWIRYGLHDLDFPGLAARPLWDLVVLLLLAGVSVGVITGAWLALKRAALDLSRLQRRF